MKIKTEWQNRRALKLVELLIDMDPPSGSYLGNALKSVSRAVEEYETEAYPLDIVKESEPPEATWRGFMLRLQCRLTQARAAIQTAVDNEEGLDAGAGEDLLILIDDDLRRVDAFLSRQGSRDLRSEGRVYE